MFQDNRVNSHTAARYDGDDLFWSQDVIRGVTMLDIFVIELAHRDLGVE